MLFEKTENVYTPGDHGSTFGGNPYFVDVERLYNCGLVTAEEYEGAKQKTPYSCEYDRLRRERVPLLMKASARADEELKSKISDFISENKHIADFCKFMALKEANDNREWTEWEVCEYSSETEYGWQFIQYEFFTQWQTIKEYANSKGIKINHIDNRIFIDVYCLLKYGVSISAVAESLRKAVKYSVENFTGMLVDAVNVHVVGVRV